MEIPIAILIVAVAGLFLFKLSEKAKEKRIDKKRREICANLKARGKTCSTCSERINFPELCRLYGREYAKDLGYGVCYHYKGF